MGRKLVLSEVRGFSVWGCSECAWVFNPSESPVGRTIEEMIQNHERQRDKDSAAHVCAEHPRAKNTKD
jgi:Zn-finger protein